MLQIDRLNKEFIMHIRDDAQIDGCLLYTSASGRLSRPCS